MLSSSDTTIECRVDSTAEMTTGAVPLIAFLKTSEEAECGTSDLNCEFTINEPLGTISAINAEWNASAQAHRITVDGNNFAGSNDEVELWVDGFLQTTISVTSNQLIFEVVEMLDSSSTDI